MVAGLPGTIWMVAWHGGRYVGAWMVPPLLVGGLGGGLVVAPNQALTLAEIPVDQASAAGGLLQTAQRLGAALGIGGVTGIFFSTLHVRHDYAAALTTGLRASVTFVAAAVVLAAVDLWYRRHRA